MGMPLTPAKIFSQPWHPLILGQLKVQVAAAMGHKQAWALVEVTHLEVLISNRRLSLKLNATNSTPAIAFSQAL